MKNKFGKTKSCINKTEKNSERLREKQNRKRDKVKELTCKREESQVFIMDTLFYDKIQTTHDSMLHSLGYTS